MIRVLSRGVGLLLLTDVVRTLTEWSLPVLLIQVRMINLIERARAWSWVAVLDLLWNLIVVVSLDADTHAEGLKPVLTGGLDLGH